MMRALITLCLMLGAWPLWAEEVVLGLSQDKVAITATYDGSELLIFGAVKRETPISDIPLHVIVAITGPPAAAIVRRKDRRLGIWVNTAQVEFGSAPTFYAVASSAPLNESLSQVEDLRHKVSINRAIRSVGAAADVGDDVAAFAEALVRVRQKTNAYQVLEGAVAMDEQTLFRTSITLPSDLTEGAYPTRIFLTREGRVVSMFETVIDVQKVGLERWLFTLSRQKPLIYGLMSLAIAVLAGWGASAVFRFLQRN